MRAAVLLTAAVLSASSVLAGCTPKPAETPGEAKSDVVVLDGATPTTPHDQPADLTGFTHEAGIDRFGYFLPTTEVKVGNWRLEAFSLGSEDEFVKWEKGERTATYAPVMLEFADVTSPKQTNELGQEVYTSRIRVLPTAYKVGPNGDLRFIGHDEKLGDVRFDGVIDMAAYKAQRTGGPNGAGTAAPVLTGGLLVGQTPFKTLSFSYFAGD